MEEAQELSDRIAIMDHGQVIANGTNQELVQIVGGLDRYDQPRGHELVRGIVAPIACADRHREAQRIDRAPEAQLETSISSRRWLAREDRRGAYGGSRC